MHIHKIFTLKHLKSLQHVSILSDFKCFNVKILCMYISWCANHMTLQNARCNDKDDEDENETS